ncbi:MAG: hypothetical protein ACOZNI_24065 [Myxococcota bacterium]
MMFALLLACAPDDACDAMCVASREQFEACMEERGLVYGESVGYVSAADFDDWCDTWTWETRLLEQQDTCDQKLAVFESGDCDAWYDAWD